MPVLHCLLPCYSKHRQSGGINAMLSCSRTEHKCVNISHATLTSYSQSLKHSTWNSDLLSSDFLQTSLFTFYEFLSIINTVKISTHESKIKIINMFFMKFETKIPYGFYVFVCFIARAQEKSVAFINLIKFSLDSHL